MRLSLSEALEATGGQAEGRAESSLIFEAVSTDTRGLGPGSLFVALKGPRFDGHDYLEEAAAKGAAGAVVSRGPLPRGVTAIRVSDTLEALGALGRHVRRMLRLKVVAITGSVGKTTTKDMAAALLRAAGLNVLQTPGNLNNRVGLPLTLLGARGDEEAAVLELGVSEPGEMEHLTGICEPDVAVVTSVAHAHTEGLGGIEGVVREKLAIARGLRPEGVLVLPHGEPLLTAPPDVRTVTFGWEEGAGVRGGGLELLGAQGSSFSVGGRTLRVSLPGWHNATNALAAVAAAEALGIDWARAAGALSVLRPAPLRGEVRETPGGVRLLVDCYNANPRAVEAALETLAGLAGSARKVAVLGEMRELGAYAEEGHRAVGRAAARLDIQALYLVGDEARWIGDEAVASGLNAGDVKLFSNREELALRLAQDLGSGDWALIKGSRAVGLEWVAEQLCRTGPERE